MHYQRKHNILLRTPMTKKEREKRLKHLRSIARKGGLATRRKYGKKHYAKMAAKSNELQWGELKDNK